MAGRARGGSGVASRDATGARCTASRSRSKTLSTWQVCRPAVARTCAQTPRAANVDAEAVARLRAAGAVIVGKTVTHEFAGGVLSPPARNPWDPGRIPGGSSGGSGAAVAAGSCLAALGTDTAGSIRIPAALCGVVGLKPTTGRVSTRGVFPLSWSLDTVGPLAKTVDDAMLVLNAILGEAPESARTAKDVQRVQR